MCMYAQVQVGITGPGGAFSPGEEINNALQRVGDSQQVSRETMQALDVAFKQAAQMDPNNRVMGRGVYNMNNKESLSFGIEVRAVVACYVATSTG